MPSEELEGRCFVNGREELAATGLEDDYDKSACGAGLLLFLF